MRLIKAGRMALIRHNRPLDVVSQAAVLVDKGRVVASGEVDDLPPFDGETVDLGDVLLLPGFVNAHTHLELTHVRPGEPPPHLADWLIGIVTRRVAEGVDVKAVAADSARQGAAQSLAFGVTTVGDISRFPAATRKALRDGPIRVVSFGEVQAMAGRRSLLDKRVAAATDLASETDRLTTAVSPHAPYTAEPDAYARCLDWATAHRRPLCTHLAEATGEGEFLRQGTGPFRRLWEAIGDWTGDVPTFDGSPVAFADHVGLLDAAVPIVLAHVNYLEAGDLDRLARGRASVAYCPRTHAHFGHPPHPFEEMLARGINVCLATDSRASTPDLDVLAELRHVARERPNVAAETLWPMITTCGAAALGLDGRVGEVSPGASADMVAFADPGGDDPLTTLMHLDAAPVATLVGGHVGFGRPFA